LLFNPAGGSYVILIPFIKTAEGKTFDGMVVNQILKSGERSYFSIDYSRIVSKSGIKEAAK